MILSQGSAYNHCFALSFWLNPLRNIMKSAAKANFPSHPMFSNSGWGLLLRKISIAILSSKTHRWLITVKTSNCYVGDRTSKNVYLLFLTKVHKTDKKNSRRDNDHVCHNFFNNAQQIQIFSTKYLLMNIIIN